MKAVNRVKTIKMYITYKSTLYLKMLIYAYYDKIHCEKGFSVDIPRY